MSKRIIAGLLALGMLVGNSAVYAAEYTVDVDQEIDLVIGNENETDNMGTDDAGVDGDQEEDQEAVPSDVITQTIEVSLAKPEILINNVLYTLDEMPRVIGGTTYVPVNTLTQYVLNGQSKWHPASRIVVIEAAGKKIQMQVNEKKVMVNGEAVMATAVPKMIDNRVWIPLKEVVSILKLPMTFDSTNKSIRIEVVGEAYQNTQPQADFAFGATNYVQGQQITLTDNSFDEDGDKLIKWQWRVNGGKVLYSMEEVKGAIGVGDNLVELRVQDAKKAWSEWARQNVTLERNQAPSVLELSANQTTFKRGEAITFDFAYDNEEWEEIVEEEWSYRRAQDRMVDAILEKPQKIFYPGEYIVSLRLKDAWGNWSESYEMKLKVSKEVVQSEMEYAFNEAPIGTILQNYNQFNFNSYEAVAVPNVIQTGSTLMMSNSPESVFMPGILYQDVLQDEIRVLYHHKNIMKNATGTERLVVMIENPNDQPILVVRKRQGNKGPATDVLHIGQQTLYDYLGPNREVQYTLAPGQKMFLFNSGDKKWRQDETLSGMIDLYCQQPLKVTVATIRAEHKLEDVVNLPYLQKDGVHTRGTFPNADHYYTFELDGKEPKKLVLGLKATEGAPWLEGYDAITGEEVLNKGNYGVRYHLRMTAKENFGLIINPRGGVFKGAIGWKDDKSYLTPKSHLNNGMQAATIGEMGKGQSRELYYMLPNGSSAPVLIGFIPESKWRTHE
ncbi:MAG: copper amine oxidase N-terminal domain-containing protein [Cellulosilyticaceae bacterium]